LYKEYSILLKYLLAYLPNLNLIKTYFRDLKAFIRCYNKYYKDSWLLEEDFRQFLVNYIYQVALNKRGIYGHFKAIEVPILKYTKQ
jgi:hypothetical protein